MKKIALISLALLTASGCGYSSRKNDLTGQVKKVIHHTPLVCPDYVEVDVSLGVMRNGTGSISNQDVWLVVTDKADEQKLDAAAVSGAPVKVTYDDKRFFWCTQNGHRVAGVEVLK